MTTTLKNLFLKIKLTKNIFSFIIWISLPALSFTADAQQKGYSVIVMRDLPADKFGFTKHKGFTASCKTNVQGGYAINHCYADFKTNTIALTFVDGEPAYGSYFMLNITGGTFCFQPHTIYPEIITGEKITYKITHSGLVLNPVDYKKANSLSGYIDVAFDEITKIPGRKININKLYLRGYFKTPLKKGYTYTLPN